MDDFNHDIYAAVRSGIAQPSPLSQPSDLSAADGMGATGAIRLDVAGMDLTGVGSSPASKTLPTGDTRQVLDFRRAQVSLNPTVTQTTTSSNKPVPPGETRQVYDPRVATTSENPETAAAAATQANLQQAKQQIGSVADTQQARQRVTTSVVDTPVKGSRWGTSKPVPVIDVTADWAGPVNMTPPDPVETTPPAPAETTPPADVPTPASAGPDFTLLEARMLAARDIEVLVETATGCCSFVYRFPDTTVLPEDPLEALDEAVVETMVRSLFSGDSSAFPVSELLGLLMQAGRVVPVEGCELPDVAPAPQTKGVPILPLLLIAGVGLLVMRYAE